MTQIQDAVKNVNGLQQLRKPFLYVISKELRPDT